MDNLATYQNLPTRRYLVGESIIEEGTRSGLMFVHKSGRLDVLKQGIHINTIRQPGSFLGEVSVLLDLPHTASVIASEDSELYIVEEAKPFLRDHPEIGLHLSTLLAHRLNSVTNYLVDLKIQFQDQDNHLEMVDEVLGGLIHQQAKPKKRARLALDEEIEM